MTNQGGDTVSTEFTNRSCPCSYGNPCHERCTCVLPASSSGCSMCCGYGSYEQRAAAAAQIIADHARAGASDDALAALKAEVECLNRPFGMHTYNKGGIHDNDCLACKQRTRLIEALSRIESASREGE